MPLRYEPSPLRVIYLEDQVDGIKIPSFIYELASNRQNRHQLEIKMKHFGRITLATLLTLPAVLSSKRLLNGWYPCSEFTFSDEGSAGGLMAECTMYTAPVCYPGICDSSDASESTVDIFVKRMPATVGDPETSTNVWVLQGGPGDSSTGMESSMVNLHNQLGGAINVYTMDHRGTGRSTFLDCEDEILERGSHPFRFKYRDLASFSMTSAATDIATFISKFTNGANTTVYDVSYGTALHIISFRSARRQVHVLFDDGRSGDGIVYKRDQYWNRSAVIPKQASVLLLNGKLDLFTPSKYAESLLAALDGDKKELFTIDHAVHDTVVFSQLVEDLANATDTCGFKLLVSFVENNGDLERLGRSCVSRMPAFNMTTYAKFHHVYLSTEDPYDGNYNSSLRQRLSDLL
ncbi:hypothetical protein PHYSODRAFT_324480 [Phytophthora sojae]|uniref:AB hydrolase-1 domain-containing protein n=1 Tax=Phytophthora sojae (strain P6497) TaxID=1094619 RepID=G4YY99_PHYSP|nr:hypothetical protein PHYSODRAFT_324480 [Phytophthora sojae]EGZ23250.1 hypothetical protein PHYSODRAFT_324480 [Phytophthora sojae]|eukprot:XP_009518538.1 hypothetical protein PHYSODRAFT_324480 [Phytophthora sojae]